MPKKSTQGRKPRSKKPKDMPKRPLSAYNLFFKEEREKILIAQREGEEQPDFVFPSEDELKSQEESGKKKAPVLFQALARCIGKRWKALPKDRVEAYEAQAKAEMEAYRQRMDKYQKETVLNSIETSSAKSRASKADGKLEDSGLSRSNGEHMPGDDSSALVNTINGFGGGGAGGMMMTNPQFGSIGLNPYGGNMNFLQSMQQFPQMLAGSFIQGAANNNLTGTNAGSNSAHGSQQEQQPQKPTAGGSIDPSFLNSMLQLSSQMQSPYGATAMGGGGMPSFMQQGQQTNAGMAQQGVGANTANMAMQQQLPFTMGAQPGLGLQNLAGLVGGMNGVGTTGPQVTNNGSFAHQQEQTQLSANEGKQSSDKAPNGTAIAASNIQIFQQGQEGEASSNGLSQSAT